MGHGSSFMDSLWFLVSHILTNVAIYHIFFLRNVYPDYDVLQGKNTYIKTPESDSGKDSNGDVVENMKPQRPFSLQVWFCQFMNA
jgi:hypothetical protein